MTKKDIIQKLKVILEEGKNFDINFTEVDLILQAYDEVVEDWVLASNSTNDNVFPLGKTGRLKIVLRKERKGVNPKTLEPIVIPQKRNIKFTTSQNVKQLLNM